MKKKILAAGLALTLLSPIAVKAETKTLKEKLVEITYASNHKLIESKQSIDEIGSGYHMFIKVDTPYKSKHNSSEDGEIGFYDYTWGKKLLELSDKGFDGTIENVYDGSKWMDFKELSSEDKKYFNELYEDTIDFFYKTTHVEERVNMYKHYLKLKANKAEK